MKAVFVIALLLSLTACKTVCPVKVQTVEVAVETMKPIPAGLTSAVATPKRPANRCKDDKGRATICNRDLATWVNEYDAALDKANGKLREILGLQPKAPD